MLKGLRKKSLSLSCFGIIFFTTLQFIPTATVSAETISNDTYIKNITASIKKDKASNISEINNLLQYAKKGNKTAIEQLKSFDCFNKKLVAQYSKNMKLAPNTSKTVVFNDGSSIVYRNITRTVNLNEITAGTAISSKLSILPADATTHVTKCTSKVTVGPVTIVEEGGVAYWYDNGRSSCHLVTTAPYFYGSGITVSSASSKILQNDITDSTYEVDATVVVVKWGIVINSGSSSDIIFVDTGGISDFEYDGIGEG